MSEYTFRWTLHTIYVQELWEKEENIKKIKISTDEKLKHFE